MRFGLDQGGSCLGVAYRLHDDKLDSELALLWRREMLMGTYRPRWVSAEFEGVPKLTFRTALQALHYALWDEEAGRLVPFRSVVPA